MGSSKVSITLKTLLMTYVLTGILLVVLSFALYKFHLKESQIQIGVNLIYILSCFLGGWVIGKAIRQRRFVWGMILGVLYFVVIFLVSLLLNRGISTDLNHVLVTMAICIVSGTGGGMVS